MFKANQLRLLNNRSILRCTNNNSRLMLKTYPLINTAPELWMKSQTILSTPLMNNQMNSLNHWFILSGPLKGNQMSSLERRLICHLNKHL